MLSCMMNNKKINLIDSDFSKDDWKKWSEKKIIFCPLCNKNYEYCHGRIRIPYFRHMDKDECPDVYSEAETQEHLQGKIDMYKWLQTVKGVDEVVLEGWIPETRQRPDLSFMYKGERYVIEYQCTPISSEYLERHELYRAAGIHDIWICGALNYFQEYHKGKGLKRVNIIEEQYGLYYDTNDQKLYIIDQMSEEVFERCRYKMVKDRIKSYIPGHGWNYYVPEEYKGNHSKARASFLNLNEMINKAKAKEAFDGGNNSTSV